MPSEPPPLIAAALAPQSAAAALALPAPCYAQPSFAAIERGAVFGASWQLVAHAAQVAGQGDHALADIAGLPLLVVRGDDGEVRALHNVCRHRAGPLAECDGRGARHFACRYHGWRYALDGRLLGAPDMGRAEGFEIGAVSLPQARLAQWQGLLFAAVGDGVPPFEEFVDGIDARLDAPLAGHEFDCRISYEVACNWKV